MNYVEERPSIGIISMAALTANIQRNTNLYAICAMTATKKVTDYVLTPDGKDTYNEYLKRKYQKIFEERFPDESFLLIFGRNYL